MTSSQQRPLAVETSDEADGSPETSDGFDPQNADATDLLLAGLETARAGQLPEAAELFAKAILKAPDSAEAYEALATVLVPLGRLEFASRAKGKAISLGYNSAASWDMLGDMLAGLGKFSDAAEAFQTSLDLDPTAEDVQQKLDFALAQNARAGDAGNASEQTPDDDDIDLFGPEFLSSDSAD